MDLKQVTLKHAWSEYPSIAYKSNLFKKLTPKVVLLGSKKEGFKIHSHRSNMSLCRS